MTIIGLAPHTNMILLSKMTSEFNFKILAEGDNGSNTHSEAVFNFWQALCYISGNKK